MALDPSIILQAGKGVTPIQSPFELAQGLNQLRAMQMQNQIHQQQIQDAADFRAQYGMSPGNAQAAQKIALGELEKQKAAHDAQKAKLESLSAFNQQQLGVLNGVKDQATWDMAQKQMAANAAAMGLDTSKSDHPPVYDPAWVENKKAQLMSFDQQVKAADLKLRQDEANRFGGFHPAVGPDGKPGIFQANKAGDIRQVPGLKPVPSASASSGHGSHGMDDPAANPNAGSDSAAERLQGVPQDLRALVQAVGTYRMMSTQLSPRQKNQIMGYVAQVFPNYNLADAEANHKFIKSLASDAPGSAGGTIAASERLLGHIGELADLTDKLGNSTFGKLGNIVSGAIDTSTGTGKAGTIKSFELAKGKVIAELNKLANGGVPHAEEMVQDVKQLQYTDPPDVKYKVLQTAAGLGLEQTRAKEAQRDNILGEFSPKTSFLSTKAQGVVQRVWKNAGAGDPGLAPPTTQGYTNTAIVNRGGGAAPTKPKLGAVVDGYVFLGGDPSKPTSWKKQ